MSSSPDSRSRRNAVVFALAFGLLAVGLAVGQQTDLRTMPGASSHPLLTALQAAGVGSAQALQTLSLLLALAAGSVATSRRQVAAVGVGAVLAVLLLWGWLVPWSIRAGSLAYAKDLNAEEISRGETPTHIGLYPYSPSSWFANEIAMHALTGASPGPRPPAPGMGHQAVEEFWFQLSALLTCALPFGGVLAARHRRWPWWAGIGLSGATFVGTQLMAALLRPRLRPDNWTILVLLLPTAFAAGVIWTASLFRKGS